MKTLLPVLFLIPILFASCGAVKSVGHGANWTYRKAADGVQGAGNLVVTGAKKLWPFGGSDEEGKREEADPTAAPTPPESPAPTYDISKLLVTDAELGDQRKTSENASESLPDGWDASGSKLSFVQEYPGTPATMLRAEGSPAKVVHNGGAKKRILSAQQIHYRHSTGLLVLKGRPVVIIGNQQFASDNAKTLLIISLRDGSFQATGPIKTSYLAP